MELGNVVEYIDREKIICAVVMEVKKQKLRLLTEANREVKISESRLAHKCALHLDLSMGRNKLVEVLKEVSNRRNALISHIDIKELWEVLNTEQEWIDLATMTEFCFPDNPTYDHESAVFRAFFKNRFYFKFNNDRFLPNSEEQVERILSQAKETARRNRIIEEGGDWVKNVLKEKEPVPATLPLAEDQLEIVSMLKSYYLFEKQSQNCDLAKTILKRSGINTDDELFRFLVKIGAWDENENIDLLRFEIPTAFPDKVIRQATELADSPHVISGEGDRRDLTLLPTITIDGQSTLDFDDALSIEQKGDCYCLGVHISDVGHFIKKGSAIDQAAVSRGSSIYMPDQKISMVPSCLAEDLCSLKAGSVRPAVSILIRLNPLAEVIDYEVVPSLVKVAQQLSYYDVNLVAEENRDIALLYDIAKKFRQKRLAQGAVQISLPEINVWIDPDGKPIVTRTNRETPGRMLVAEIMIMANWLLARFLAKNGMPAVYRSQPQPRDRLYKNGEGTLFQNWMQRKQLNRFVLGHEPEHHSGLGLEAYVTATSPIRKYFDLATQRQIRAVLGLETPYTAEEIRQIIQWVESPMSQVSKLQYQRNRYWLLKYLEGKIGQKEEAIVLMKRRNQYQVLLTEHMIECNLPAPGGVDLKPEDLIQVTIQHVNARKDVISVFLG